ncbi:MAG: hypothetical protein NWE92_13050 [Candidatus Bathyarchaeota archaeon]|nr:hypothetical protein [Candidatus Bathyarchaeota archaeon]
MKKIMHFAVNTALIITLLCTCVFFSPVNSSGLEDALGPYYVTASAGEGGSISPSGTSSYPYLSDASFTITPSAGNSINEISIDGGKPFPATQFSFNQSYINNNINKNIELFIVNGQRYLLVNTWIHTPVTIYAADSNWMPTTQIAVSPLAVDFIYIPTLSKNVTESSLFPNCMVFCGNQPTDESFIALYNMTSNSWIWETVASLRFITDVLNPSSTDLIIHIADTDFHGFAKTTKDNLFDSNSWEYVSLPASQTRYLQNEFLDTSITYFKGSIYTQTANAQFGDTASTFSWCAYKYDLASNAWASPDPILSNIDPTVPGSDGIYPKVWADDNILLLVAPFSNGTWSIYYSTDGSTFNVISSVASANNFQGYQSHPNSELSWASTFDGNSNYILFESTTANDAEGYLAVMDLNGTIIYKQKGLTVHYSQATQWMEETTPEGKTFVVGTTCDIHEYPAVLRKLSIAYHSDEPFTFTFDNIAANHTINASFNNPYSPTPTPSPSPTDNKFLIESNSTISALSFNATTPEISFTVNGTSGTTGYINATISKSLMPNGENIKIYLDGNPYNYSITSNDDWWFITFTYQHSTHQVKIVQSQDSGSTNDSSIYMPYLLAAIVAALVGFLALIIWSTKQKEPSTPPKHN